MGGSGPFSASERSILSLISVISEDQMRTWLPWPPRCCLPAGMRSAMAVVRSGVFVTWVQLFFARFRAQISWRQRRKLITDAGVGRMRSGVRAASRSLQRGVRAVLGGLGLVLRPRGPSSGLCLRRHAVCSADGLRSFTSCHLTLWPRFPGAHLAAISTPVFTC